MNRSFREMLLNVFFYQRRPLVVYSAYTKFDDINNHGNRTLGWVGMWVLLTLLVGTLLKGPDFGSVCAGLLIAAILVGLHPFAGTAVVLLFAYKFSLWWLLLLEAVVAYELLYAYLDENEH